MSWKYHKPKFEYDEALDPLNSAWLGHVFFAYDLTRNIKPERFVELGTHFGHSFFSFCQAAKDGKLKTRLTAIDTWKGDEQSGFYGENVYDLFKSVKQKYYSELKIEILRKNFDDAVDQFEDNSIDILHIDGLHTYEAVKHDFETWIVKVKDSGIILFHDTSVKRENFGVHKLWEELKKNYITFGFEHSNGLGVLVKNANQGNAILKLEGVWRCYYSAIGENKRLEYQIKRENDDLKKTKNENAMLLNRMALMRLEASENNRIIDQQLSEIQSLEASKFFKMRDIYMISKKIFFRMPHLIIKGLVVLHKGGPREFLRRMKSLLKSKKSTKRGSSDYNLKRISINQKIVSDWRIIRERAQSFDDQPLISIIMPVYNVETKWLKKAIDSVLGQIYENWELCIVDDASTIENIRPFLNEYYKKDGRIKLKFLEKNQHISAASNEALEMAEGEFVAFMDNDDEISPDTLFEIAKFLNQKKDADVIYSDEDKIDEEGKYSEPTKKPDWNLDRLLKFNYTAHLSVYRKKIVDRVGRLRVGYEGAQDYDLMLRVSEKTKNIFHLEKILYHWRKLPSSVSVNPDSKPYAYEAGKRAIESYMKRNRINGVVRMPVIGRYKIEKIS